MDAEARVCLTTRCCFLPCLMSGTIAATASMIERHHKAVRYIARLRIGAQVVRRPSWRPARTFGRTGATHPLSVEHALRDELNSANALFNTSHREIKERGPFTCGDMPLRRGRSPQEAAARPSGAVFANVLPLPYIALMQHRRKLLRADTSSVGSALETGIIKRGWAPLLFFIAK